MKGSEIWMKEQEQLPNISGTQILTLRTTPYLKILLELSIFYFRYFYLFYVGNFVAENLLS